MIYEENEWYMQKFNDTNYNLAMEDGSVVINIVEVLIVMI